MDYIKFIRSKVGHERIFITCASILIQREDGKVLVETRTDNGMHALSPLGQEKLNLSIKPKFLTICTSKPVSSLASLRAVCSTGRASALHAEGSEFDSRQLHQIEI